MPDPNDIRIRRADAADVPAISRLIVDSLHSSNARDYGPDIIARLAASFSPDRVATQLAEREVVVALLGARLVGTASLDNATVRAVFVAPDFQHRGIGRTLMCEMERLARAKEITTLRVRSSITAERFYLKLGFVAVGDKYRGAERTIMMERHLAAGQ